jgi:hypothetical protein
MMLDDIWQPLRYFEGNWTGTGRGEPGTAIVNRDYSFILSGRYLQVRSESKWEPTEKNPEGEVHTEMGMFSYDKARKLFVLRVFHVEGFVNQYVQDLQATKGVDLRFMSEAIENISPGWRARESYRILGPDEFVETFELAEPGKDFELYTESRLKRAK